MYICMYVLLQNLQIFRSISIGWTINHVYFHRAIFFHPILVAFRVWITELGDYLCKNRHPTAIQRNRIHDLLSLKGQCLSFKNPTSNNISPKHVLRGIQMSHYKRGDNLIPFTKIFYNNSILDNRIGSPVRMSIKD